MSGAGTKRKTQPLALSAKRPRTAGPSPEPEPLPAVPAPRRRTRRRTKSDESRRNRGSRSRSSTEEVPTDFNELVRTVGNTPNDTIKRIAADLAHDIEGGIYEIGMRGHLSGINRDISGDADISAFITELVTENGSARPSVILEKLDTITGFPNKTKVGVFAKQDMAALAAVLAENGCTHILIDALTTNPFKYGLGARPFTVIHAIVSEADGACKLSANTLKDTAPSARLDVRLDPYTVSHFYANYEHQMRRDGNDNIIEIRNAPLNPAAAADNVVTVSCPAGFSVNSLCRATGIPPPRSGENSVSITVTQPITDLIDTQKCDVMLVKTLTDWAQIHYAANMWHTDNIKCLLITNDNFCLRIATLLKVPFVLHMQREFHTLYCFDDAAMRLTDTTRRIIRARLAEARDSADTLRETLANIFTRVLNDPLVQEDRDMGAYLVRRGLELEWEKSIRALDDLLIGGNTDATLRKFSFLQHMTAKEYVESFAGQISIVIQKYRKAVNRIQTILTAMRSDDARPTPARLIFQLQSSLEEMGIPEGEHDKIIGVWLSYLDIANIKGEENSPLTRIAAITFIRNAINARNPQSPLVNFFDAAIATHRRFDSNATPKIGVAMFFGNERGDKSLTIFIPRGETVVIEERLKTAFDDSTKAYEILNAADGTEIRQLLMLDIKNPTFRQIEKKFMPEEPTQAQAPSAAGMTGGGVPVLFNMSELVCAAAKILERTEADGFYKQSINHQKINDIITKRSVTISEKIYLVLKALTGDAYESGVGDDYVRLMNDINILLFNRDEELDSYRFKTENEPLQAPRAAPLEGDDTLEYEPYNSGVDASFPFSQAVANSNSNSSMSVAAKRGSDDSMTGTTINKYQQLLYYLLLNDTVSYIFLNTVEPFIIQNFVNWLWENMHEKVQVIPGTPQSYVTAVRPSPIPTDTTPLKFRGREPVKRILPGIPEKTNETNGNVPMVSLSPTSGGSRTRKRNRRSRRRRTIRRRH